ncbi:hypothetical protein [Paracoccus shanxieyensis]|uniref:Uncharacterized protein n=1 Tax=Paracoccus shanxieyensis TaxID=2675752 RepID=A0A6L6IWD5_9RHOB|nr:hypothetical protein [Paracoccus shanxieyensis]MTH63360.1 hypothetical protein [Paracoccus shanxieyensis]MTH86281.1 hypothetical protein [Paracoccus shanxieyensis]
MPKPRPQTPRQIFNTALADWQRAWTTHARHDRHAATAGYATATGQAHLAAMTNLATRIAAIEAQIAETPANSCAELQIKITILSVDGQIREEFQRKVLDDLMRVTVNAFG